MSQLFLDLQRDEGQRLHAYPDPLTGGPPWTIGYGHTGRDVYPGLVWTETKALAALQRDMDTADTTLAAALPWLRLIDSVRREALVNMAFNLGVHGLLSFTTFLTLVKNGAYIPAAADVRRTPWFRQVGERAVRLAKQIETGQHQTW